MLRREFIAGLGSTACGPLLAHAQPATSTIGWLHPEVPEAVQHIVSAFHQGLAETGYVEGRNVVVDYRWAEGHTDRLPVLAANLVLRKVAVIVVVGTAAALAAKAATQTIPTVFLMGSDPIEIGLAASFARPTGNLTGIAMLYGEIAAKRLALLHELVPTASLIGMLVNPTNPVITQAETKDLPKSPLFRSARSRTGALKGEVMHRVDAWRMIQRRARELRMKVKIGCHTFRATGITAYLEAGGTLENAQAMAAHESPRTTKLYDRTGDEITLAEVERIAI
jgi:hypothetical protein